MVKVKICGLKRMEDIEYINELLPDYVGFVFAKSKRQIDIYHARKMIERLNKDIETVGVFVNQDINEVLKIASHLKLNVLQFHGGETPEYIEKFNGYKAWKAVHVTCAHDLEKLELYDGADALLLDSSINGMYGGTGKCFDWNIIKGLKVNKPLVIAGGLNPENVNLVLSELEPFAVDVSSGVETDGVKDYSKIKEFIDKARGLF